MGLLSLIRKIKRIDGEARIVLLGLDNSGKSSLLRELLNISSGTKESTDSINPTNGFMISTMNYEGYKINFWDIGGIRKHFN